MVSFDVESLFPSVPVDEALVAMDEWLTENMVDLKQKEAFLAVASLCMEDSYFKFREKFYKLGFGTSMGNPISPLIADLFLSKLEKSLKERNLLPRWWYRYVDDVVAVIKKSELDQTLHMLNSQFPTINFTVVPEEDGQLAFLDLLLIRKNNKVELAVYHKPTSTQRFIPSTSHCPIQHKMAPFHSMAHRLCKLPLSITHYKREYDYIQQAAKVNGFDSADIDRIIKHHSDKIRKNRLTTFFSQLKKEDPYRVCLTYAPKITNKLKSAFRKQNMQIVYRTQNKLSNFLGSTKDKPKILEKSGIYQIICPCCQFTYYGQTRRQVQIRYREHLGSIRNNQPSKSSVAEHALNNLHLNFNKVDEAFDKGELKLLKAVMNPMRLDAYESYYIHRHAKIKPNVGLMNSDSGNVTSYLFNCIK